MVSLPFIFKPPKPPDDLAIIPQVQIYASSEEKKRKNDDYCQICGLKLTKEDQINHSCNTKPE